MNLSKSGTKWEIFEILVDMDCDPDILEEIQKVVENLNKENPTEYGPGQRARYKGTEKPFKLVIQVLFEYTHAGIDLKRTAIARSYVLEKIAEVMRKRSISYTLPAMRDNRDDKGSRSKSNDEGRREEEAKQQTSMMGGI